jgi:hypothetical protein
VLDNPIPTHHSDTLFNLIKTLTKAEKRNFKLYANRTQSRSNLKFIQLFDILDKQKEPNDEQVLKKIEGLKKNQLANMKQHLYRQILKSLRLIHQQKNVSIEIREQIDYAYILYGKGLYMQSLKLLEKCRQLARENHLNILHLEILEFQKLIEERHITRSRKIKKRIEGLLTDSETQSEIIHNRSKLANLKIEIHGFYIKYGHVQNERDIDIVHRLFQSGLTRINQERLSFFEKIFLHQAYVWYYYILLDFKNCYGHALKWVQIIDDNPQFLDFDPDIYMRGLHYVLTSAYNTRAIDKFNHHLEHIKSFEKERRDVFNDNSTIIAFLYIQTSSLNKHYLMGTFNEGVKEIPALLEKLNEYSSKMDIHRILVFYYKIAYMYIGNEDYDTALDYLNAILDLDAVDLREDIQNYAHLLSILAHFELGNYQLLEYMVGKVRKLLSKTKELNALQRKTFRFFNNIIRQPESEHMELFKKFREEIRIIEDDPLSIRDFIYLDVPAWIDSKIEKKSMSEIIKNRLRTEKS